LGEGVFCICAFVHFSFWLAMVIQADMRRFFSFLQGRDNMMVSPGLPFNAQSGVLSIYRRRIPTAVA
jgi:hypothetical protein